MGRLSVCTEEVYSGKNTLYRSKNGHENYTFLHFLVRTKVCKALRGGKGLACIRGFFSGNTELS